jgi:hypothetical protein
MFFLELSVWVIWGNDSVLITVERMDEQSFSVRQKIGQEGQPI